jgi:hypothetical protein
MSNVETTSLAFELGSLWLLLLGTGERERVQRPPNC